MDFFSTFFRKFKTSKAEPSKKNIWSHNEKNHLQKTRRLHKFTEKRRILRRQDRFIGFQREFLDIQRPQKVASLKVNKSVYKNQRTTRRLQKQKRITEDFRKELAELQTNAI